MSPFDERMLENFANAHRFEASVAATSGVDFSFSNIRDPTPALSEMEHRFWKEWWEERHPKPPPPPQWPDQLGPWSHHFTFPDGMPVGGWTELTLHRDGSWNYSGHLHDSGTPSYNDSVVWAVKNLGTNETYLFPHTGRMHGSIEAGSRDDNWTNSGTNAALESGWDSLFSVGWHWACKAGIGIDVGSIIDAAQKVVGVAETVISFL
jgi:hypothetical protein